MCMYINSFFSSSPNQLFMPHISVLDFIPWPAFRELAVQLPAMQERMVWLITMMTTIRCDWWHTPEEALFQHNETGLVDLSPLGKVSLNPSSCRNNVPTWVLPWCFDADIF